MNPHEEHQALLEEHKQNKVKKNMKIYELHKLRALRKQSLIKRCADQALAAKRQLIENGKGNNGLSMNNTLLERHFSVR